MPETQGNRRPAGKNKPMCRDNRSKYLQHRAGRRCQTFKMHAPPQTKYAKTSLIAVILCDLYGTLP